MRALALIPLLALAAACGGEAGNEAAPAENGAAAAQAAPDGTIGRYVAGSAQHRTLARAVEAAGLGATLSGAGPYTLFAPTDAAFAALPAGTVDGLMQPQSKGPLARLLAHHAVPGVVMAEDLGRAIEAGGGKAELATLGGGTLTVTRDGDALVVADGSGGNARVTAADAGQANGIVHSVDRVLMPGAPASGGPTPPS